MSSIQYKATQRVVNAARLDTIQTFIIPESGNITIDQFSYPTTVFDRSYEPAMDHNSGRGTIVSSYDTSVITLIMPLSEAPNAEEMLHSLSDYQIGEFDGTDIDYFNRFQRFIMTDTQFSPEIVGCTHIRYSFNVKWQP